MTTGVLNKIIIINNGAMKKNTQKLLLSLYFSKNQVQNRVPQEIVKILLSSLSDGGRRSLLFLLKRKNLIDSERVLGKTTVSLTNYGVTQLEAEFPALSQKWDSWEGEWECLVFLSAPKSDQQFRYLRQLLLSEGAINVSRGVYFAPKSFSDVVLSTCRNLYLSNLLLFSVGDWKIVNERSVIIEKYGLLDIVESYSGVSRDVDRLLVLLNDKKRAVDSLKNDINLVYDRLVAILVEDPGFCMFFFPQAILAKEILLRLNSSVSQQTTE